MKTRNFYTRILALLFCGAPLILPAQQDPMVSQYMFSGHFLNPAYAGSHPYGNVTLLGRKQWVGFDGSPFTTYLSFDMPIAKEHIGVGALVSNDQIGVTKRTQVSGTFSYHLHLSEKARLSAGLSLGAQFYSAKLTSLTIWDEQDQVFTSDIAGKTLPVAGLGLYYYTHRFYAGFSIPNVISYKPGTPLYWGGLDAPQLERHYFGTMGYAIPVNKNLDIKPSILVKAVPHTPVQLDYNLHVLLYKTLWLGASYRHNEGMVGMVEYNATKNLRIGYAYDMALTNMRNYNSGSHEIMLAWDFVKSDDIKFKSPRFF
jgi:type IX secretion system PorP/SprF family membrane protein